jgi:hypothetical protein
VRLPQSVKTSNFASQRSKRGRLNVLLLRYLLQVLVNAPTTAAMTKM